MFSHPFVSLGRPERRLVGENSPTSSINGSFPERCFSRTVSDSTCMPHLTFPSVSKTRCLEPSAIRPEELDREALNSYASRSMYQELKPIKKIAPVIASSNASSFEPEGQSQRVDERCRSDKSVNLGHSQRD